MKSVRSRSGWDLTGGGTSSFLTSSATAEAFDLGCTSGGVIGRHGSRSSIGGLENLLFSGLTGAAVLTVDGIDASEVFVEGTDSVVVDAVVSPDVVVVGVVVGVAFSLVIAVRVVNSMVGSVELSVTACVVSGASSVVTLLEVGLGVATRSILYGNVTLSNFKMFAVRFSGTFGNGFTFSMVVFLGFMRTAVLVIVNGRKVDVFK